MANLFQGAPLPSVSTTQQTTTTAPEWYNNFLSGLATTGQQAVQQGGVAGPSTLQQQAYAAAPTAIQAGQGAGAAAQQGAAGVIGTNVPSMVDQYLNPYTQSVVAEIGRLGQRQFRETLAPGVTAGAVGSGQFGSKRGMQIYGNVARDVNADILGAQSKALQEGYLNALKAAGEEESRNIQASQVLGGLGQQEYERATGGLNVLSQLGGQQQATEQARLNYPMTAAQNYANLMRGFNVPTSTTQRYTGPMPGAYQTSPLAQILGLVSGGAGIFTPRYDKDGKPISGSSQASVIGSALSDILGGIKNFVSSNQTQPYYIGNNAEGGALYWNPSVGGYSDAQGNPINVTDYEGE